MEHPIRAKATTAPAGARLRDAAVVVIMGVSGAGKTTVGEALARRLGCAFVDGDSLHPPANVAKMRAGAPLDDDDRRPWLAAIAARIDGWLQSGEAGVVACSALKRRYRNAIISDRRAVRLVCLDGSRALIADRLDRRRGHFMPAALLDSQFATLEPPTPEENAVIVSIDNPVEAIVECIVTALSSPHATMAGAGTMAPA